MGRLDGKVAVITGAGSGIGRASAILFAKEGAKVVVADCVAEAGEETAKMVGGTGGEAIFVKTDVSNAEDVRKLIKITIDTYGRLEVLFNNAGVTAEVASIVDSREGNWDRTIAINLKSVWLGMKYAIPEMLKVGGGSIINTASPAGERGTPNISAYSASKGGVLALSRGTAIEYACRNIRVNCINPGLIATPMIAAQVKDDPRAKKTYEEAVPQGRLGTPEEVAQVALFLASDESSHVTGHALVVDGGMEASSRITPAAL